MVHERMPEKALTEHADQIPALIFCVELPDPVDQVLLGLRIKGHVELSHCLKQLAGPASATALSAIALGRASSLWSRDLSNGPFLGHNSPPADRQEFLRIPLYEYHEHYGNNEEGSNQGKHEGEAPGTRAVVIGSRLGLGSDGVSWSNWGCARVGHPRARYG
jgi:hypothetical protein